MSLEYTIGVLGLGEIGKHIEAELRAWQIPLCIKDIVVANRTEEKAEKVQDLSYFPNITYELAKEKYIYSSNRGNDFNSLCDCDLIVFAVGAQPTPVEFEQFNAKGLNLVIEEHAAFLRRINSDFYPDIKKELTEKDIENLLGIYSPLISEDYISQLKAAKENKGDADDKKDTIFVEKLKTAVNDCWKDRIESIPANVFNRIPDVVFEHYMDRAAEEGLKDSGEKVVFLDEENEKDDKVKNEFREQFEIYRTLRKLPTEVGYREIRLFPFIYREVKDVAKKLKENKHSLIAVVSNPVDYVVELLYRCLGKEFANRIFGVNYVDSSRHTALKNKKYNQLVRDRESSDRIKVYERLTKIEALAIGPHNRFATLLKDFNTKDMTRGEFEAMNQEMQAESRRLWEKVTSWPAIYGKDTYLEVCPALMRALYKLLIRKESLPNSVRLKLGEMRNFSQNMKKKEQPADFPIGYFSRLKLNEEKKRLEVEIADWNKIRINEEEAKSIVKGFLKGFHVFEALERALGKLHEQNENIKEFPRIPEMPIAFDLGYLRCENSNGEIVWFRLDSSTSGKRHPEKTLKLSFDRKDEDHGYAAESPLFAYRNLEKSVHSKTSIVLEAKEGEWLELARLKDCEITRIKRLQNRTFIEYNCQSRAKVACIDDDGKKIDLENIIEICTAIDGCFIARKPSGLVKISNNLEHLIDFDACNIRLTGVKINKEINLVSAMGDAGKIFLWDISTGKRVGEGKKIEGNNYEILETNGKVILYFVSKNQIKSRHYDSIGDFLKDKTPQGTCGPNIPNGYSVEALLLAKDRDSEMNLLATIAREKVNDDIGVFAFSEDLEPAGMICFSDKINLRNIKLVYEVEKWDT